jgi:hypothetical protein
MLRVRANWVGVPGSPYVTNMYFGDSNDPQECVDHMAEFLTIVSAVVVNEAAWSIEPDVATVDPVSGAVTASVTVDGANGQGVSTEEILPPSQQILVRWNTGAYINGRQLRGRTFVPALGDDTNVNGTVDGTYRTAIIGDVTTWLGAGPVPLIWSKSNGETRLVLSVDVWEQFAVLRSRRD